MKKYLVILKKELKDCFRDKRSLIMMLLPLLIFPILLSLTNQQMKTANDTVTNGFLIASNAESEIAELVETLRAADINVEAVATDTPYDDLKAGKILLVVDKADIGYSFVFDQNSFKSTMALSTIVSAIEAQKLAYIHSVFNQYGEDIGVLEDYTVLTQDVSAISDETSNSFLAIIAPMVLVMFIASGGSSVALDLFCGEKERGSMEGLLATQVGRKPLYLAKVTTVFIFACISTVISVMGYLMSFTLGGDTLSGELNMSATQIILFFLTTLSFAFFSSSVISLLSVSAKTTKEGSLRTSLFTIIPGMLSGISMYMETGNLPLFISLVPIVNIIAALKSVFIDVIHPTNLILTIASTAIYGMVFLAVGYKVINSEKVLAK